MPKYHGQSLHDKDSAPASMCAGAENPGHWGRVSRADHPLRARRPWKYWTRPKNPQPQPQTGEIPDETPIRQPNLPGRAEMPLPGESRAITGALPIARSTLNKQIHPENTLRLPKTALRGEPPRLNTSQEERLARNSRSRRSQAPGRGEATSTRDISQRVRVVGLRVRGKAVRRPEW